MSDAWINCQLRPISPTAIWTIRILAISPPLMLAHFWRPYRVEEIAAQMTPKVITGTQTSPCYWCTSLADKLEKMHKRG